MQMQLQRSEEVSEEAILAAALKDIEILRMRAPSPDICDVCRMPVLDDGLRTKNHRGAYVHAKCAAAPPYAGGGAQVHARHLDASSAPRVVSSTPKLQDSTVAWTC